MAIFGNKKDDDKKKNIFSADEVDSKLLAAIEETDAELEQNKADARKNEEERVKRQNAKIKAEEMIKNLPNEGRRSFILVKSAEVLENAIEVRGNLAGELHTDDTAYVYRPGGTVVEGKISVIKPDAEEIKRIAEIKGISEDENKDIPDVAERIMNSPVLVTIELDLANIGIAPEKIIPAFTVVSTIKPSVVGDKSTPLENPALFGMTLEYKTYMKDKEYMNHFMRHAVNARYVVPCHHDGVNPETGKPNLKIIAITNKQDKRALPLFTDVAALSLWKNIFDEEHKPSVVVMTFPEAVKLADKDGIGFVINPMGPVAIELPRELITNITSSKGYKAQFGDASSKAKYRKETITDGSKIVVGELPNIEECKLIRDAFKSYGLAHPEIVSIGLLAMRKEKKNSYLVIVDCPKGVSREIFSDLYAAAKPFMNAVKDMHFSLYAETVFADQYFADHTFDYVKNPNV